MKKLIISILLLIPLMTLTGCNEKNMTIYDYLTNESALMETLNQCRSRSLTDEVKCETVKMAYAYLDLFKRGKLDEKTLRELGKK